MFFDSLDFVDNTDIFVGKIVNLNEEGYIYGNMFKDEYIPYKNYKVYRLSPRSEEENLKLKIMEHAFKINDLNLYLDLHPKDTDIYNYFRKEKNELDSYIDEYESKYGSICLNAKMDSYNWIKDPWPWEDEI